MFDLKDEKAVIALCTEGVREGLHLEYKASAAINKKNDSTKVEMARDVSAFANADGGQIVYGMTEKDHEPAGLDDGFDPKEYPEIWFEQVLQQHVSPTIQGLRPRHVPLASGRVAVVIDVPAAKGDPHQVDGRYYRRHNFNRLIMEHYEVRDAFRRTTTPDLLVTLSFIQGNDHTLEFGGGTENSRPFNLIARIENRALQPAYFVVVDIGVSIDFAVVSRGGYDRLDQADNSGGTPMHWFRWSLASPPALPIFKEHPRPLTNEVLMLALHSRFARSQPLLDLTVKISSPGFSSTENWAIVSRAGRMRLYPPGSPYTDTR